MSEKSSQIVSKLCLSLFYFCKIFYGSRRVLFDFIYLCVLFMQKPLNIGDLLKEVKIKLIKGATFSGL